jgi:hypothetical protein
MYLPLVGPLTDAGIDVRFALIPGYSKNNEIPRDERMSVINVWNPDQCMTVVFHNKLKMFYYAYHSLLPAWRKYLEQFEGGAVVVAQDGAPVQRLLLNLAKKHGFNRVAMQDGYFVSIPTKYGWGLEGKKKLFLKKLISFTPFRRFIALGFGTATDYCGLYGKIERKAFCQNKVFSWEQTSVIGSPRFSVFRKRVSDFELDKRSGEVRVLCLPSTFPSYRDSRLDEAQDKALKWTCNVVKELRSICKSDISINIKVKRGYNHIMQRYRNLLNGPGVSILAGDERLERLIAEARVIVTMGSTAALEAAVCNKPVVQVMPSYLYDRYMKISGLPVAKNEADVRKLLEEALFSPKEYIRDCYGDVSKELADIDPEWDSIEETKKWLLEIVNMP